MPRALLKRYYRPLLRTLTLCMPRFSDLHIDVNARTPWTIPDPRPEHDIVIIAGDICQGLERGVLWIAEYGFNRKPVVYVPGNHEYYGFDF